MITSKQKSKKRNPQTLPKEILNLLKDPSSNINSDKVTHIDDEDDDDEDDVDEDDDDALAYL